MAQVAERQADFDASVMAPPHNIEVEESVLNCAIKNENGMGVIVELFGPNYKIFYSKQHQFIYQALYELYRSNSPTDFLSLKDHLSSRKRLEAAGGEEKLRALCNGSIATSLIEHYCLLLADKYLRRQVICAADDIKGYAYSSDLSGEDVIDQAQRAILSIEVVAQRSSVPHISEVFTGMDENPLTYTYEVPSTGETITSTGVPTGLVDLDAVTQGLNRSDLVICAARPAMGKTSLMVQIVFFIGVVLKLPVVVFTLEMSAQQLVKRMIALEARIDFKRVLGDRLTREEQERQSEVIARMMDAPIHIDETTGISSKEIVRRTRTLEKEIGEPLALVAIDYLQLIEEKNKKLEGDRVQELSLTTRTLKGLARDGKTCVYALSQLNRGVESRTNKRPMMSDLRESGSIEQDADLIMMLYRDEYYHPDTHDRGVAEIILTKHRNGPVGTAKTLFDSRYMRFINRRNQDIQEELQERIQQISDDSFVPIIGDDDRAVQTGSVAVLERPAVEPLAGFNDPDDW